MKKTVNFALVLAAIIALASFFASCSSGGSTDNSDYDINNIKCKTSNDCPTGWKCLDSICRPPSADGDATIDGDESDGSDVNLDQEELQVLCNYLCCTDQDCVPANWKEGDPKWYCDHKATEQSTCKQEELPCQYECCTTKDCVDKDPKHCSTWFCNAKGTPDAKCQDDMPDSICTVGYKYCVNNEVIGLWYWDECKLDAGGCKFKERQSCDLILDCDQLMNGQIQCIHSGRCRSDADCELPKKCNMEAGFPELQLGRCLVPRVGKGEICVKNCDDQGQGCETIADCFWETEVDNDRPTCCIKVNDPNTQCPANVGTGYCGRCTTKAECQ